MYTYIHKYMYMHINICIYVYNITALKWQEYHVNMSICIKIMYIQF
jgi:hypothetical protein